MSIGTYTISMTPASNQGNYSTTAYTYVTYGRFNTNVRMRSVFFMPNFTGTTSLFKVVIYDNSNVKVFDGAYQTITATSGTPCEISLGTYFDLVGGAYYQIGVFNNSGLQMGYVTAYPSTTVYSSSPSLATWTENSAGGYRGTGDAVPTTTVSGTDWVTGFSFDRVNTAPSVFPTAPAGTTINNKTTTRFYWSYGDAEGNVQSQYEISYRKRGDISWTVVTNTSANAYHDFAPDTFEDAVYDWQVRVYDGALWSPTVATTFTNVAWTYLTDTASSTASGVLNATALTAGSYDIEVRVSDAVGGYGPWSTLQTFALSPASNRYFRQGGSFVQAGYYIRQGGAWVQLTPAKVRTGGTFP
jgi:hypothetical protein